MEHEHLCAKCKTEAICEIGFCKLSYVAICGECEALIKSVSKVSN